MLRSVLGLIALFSLGACGDAPFDLDAGASPALGAAYVRQRGCAACHQSGDTSFGELSGQEVPFAGTLVYGSNLTPDVLTGLGNWSDVQIIRAMIAGVDDQLAQLCPPSPHLGDLSELEARSIVDYLRTLPPVYRADVPASLCPPLKPFLPDLSVAGSDDGGTP